MINYGLENKIALITGGTEGMGRVMVDEFLAQGCTVVFAARNQENGKRVSEETGAEYVCFDLLDRQSIEALFAHIKEKYGRLDILVNNAASCRTTKSEMTAYDYELVEKFFMTNSLGTYKCIQEGIKLMLEQEDPGGSIVSISSTTTVMPSFGVSHYAASKAAINGMTYAAAGEYAAKGIRINSVMCSAINTEQFRAILKAQPEKLKGTLAKIPMGRVGEPQEYIKAVLWLCSEDASYVNGSCLLVDGANVHTT